MQDARSIPQIAPLADNWERPLWSVMIPSFNCAEYLRQTLQSVLEQAPSPDQMQIEVVDDCSTKDDPEAVVREVGRGRVSFHRQPVNQGPTKTFNLCIERSRGKYVHILHGDDLVRPRFYESVMRCFKRHPEAGIVITRCFVIDATGELIVLSPRLQWLETPSSRLGELYYSNPIRTPGVVVKRSAYEAVGGFNTDLIHVADWEMWLRLIRSGQGLFLNKPLADYRMFAQNHTSQLMRTGGNLHDQLKLLNILIEDDAPELDVRRATKAVAASALDQALHFRANGDMEACRANLQVWRNHATKGTRLKAWVRSLMIVKN